MSFVPVSPLLETIYDLQRADPDAAGELVRIGLFESLSKQIEDNRQFLDETSDAFIAARAAKARSHLLRDHVSKALDGQAPADATSTAAYLAVIDTYVAKGVGARLFGTALSQFNTEHKRNASGQFETMSTTGDKHTPNGPRNASGRNEVHDKVKEWQASGNLDAGGRVMLHFTDRNGGKKTTALVGADPDKINEAIDANIKNKSRILAGASYDPAKGPKGTIPNRGAYDAMLALTGDPETARRIADGSTRTPTPSQGNTAASQWNNLTSGTDRQSYRRMAMTGNALT